MKQPPHAPNPARRTRFLPLHLKLQSQEDTTARERVVRQPFRLGFGKDCDIQLRGGEGPDVVFEVERTRGPLLIANALAPEQCAHYVDLKINGEPLHQPMQQLEAGTHLEIVEKATGRKFQLVVEPHATHRWLRPRNLAVLIVLLVVIGSGFGWYLYTSLRGTQTEIERTRERVGETEAELARTSRELMESVRRMGSTDAELALAIRELNRLQARSSSEIREDFAQRIAEIEAQTRRAVAEVAEQDIQQRKRLAEDAQARVSELREEFSRRMVESYQQLKTTEQSLHGIIAEKFSDRQLEQTTWKRVYGASRDAVLFVRTRYQMRFAASPQPRELSSLGTAFLTGPNGRAVSAQHVLFPWRYDRELLVLSSLELATLVPDSVEWSVWPFGARVLADPDDGESFDESQAYRSGDLERGMRMLVAPEPQLTPTVVSSPLGLVELPMPVPGPGDVAVFQIMAPDAGLSHLTLRRDDLSLEALDEVLVVGHPYSRLKDGLAWPQGVRGFVRRIADELIEIDAAVHPGLSGGPLLDAEGHVAGMVSAIIGSEVYGVAIKSAVLATVLDSASEHVAAEQRRLTELSCSPGRVDGVFDRATWDAYRCEAERSR